MSSKNWACFCFINFCQRNDRRPRVRVVQCLKNRDAVKTRINIHNRQIDIIQPKSQYLERRAPATRASEPMPSFSRRCGDGGAQFIVIRYKQNIRLHRAIMLPTPSGLAARILRMLMQKLL